MSLPETPAWMTDEMLRAEARLGEATHALEMELERARQLVDATRPEPLPDGEVEEFRKLCTGPEWDAVARRVEQGEVTWRDVAEGNLAGDPGVDAAVRSLCTPKGPESGPQPDAGPVEDDDDYFAMERFIEPE